jgi:hypothetical protein
MPRYTATPGKDSALGFVDVPDGIYEVVATKVAAFARENEKGDLSFGVRVSTRFVEGEFKDKSTTPLQLYYHTQGGKDMAKTHLMGIFGYAKDQETQFNDWADARSWGFDTDTKAVDDSFAEIKGKRFAIQIVNQIVPGTDKTRNNISNVFPLSA